MNLDNFTEKIDPKIVSRGIRYFDEGKVESVIEIRHNVYECIIQGSDEYCVEVSLDDDHEIESSYCDCPYDLGEYCKHEVAAFLAIQDYRQNNEHPNSFQLGSTDHRRVEDILDDLSREDAISFIKELAQKDDVMIARIKLRFGSMSDDMLLRKSILLIHNCLGELTDHYGEISYELLESSLIGVHEVFHNTQKYIEEGKIELSIRILLETFKEIEQFKSNNDIYDIYILEDERINVIELLKECFHQPQLTNEKRNELYYKMLRKSYEYLENEDFLYAMIFVELAVELTENSYQQEAIDELIEDFLCHAQEEYRESEYLETLRFYQYRCIQKTSDEESAEKFLNLHLELPMLRKFAINRAIDYSDYETALKLCKEGELSNKEKSKDNIQWKELRFEVYEKIGNLELMHDLAIELILLGDESYYDKLKSRYDQIKWNQIYPEILSKLEFDGNTGSWVYFGILIKENEKGKLIRYLEMHPSLTPNYYQHVLPEYKQEVIDILAKFIRNQMPLSNSRNQYIKIRDLIQTMVEIGGSNEGKEIQSWIHQTFPRRRALIEEIEKIQLD